jgi:hypothetical protein
MKEIVHIVPYLPPSISGVGDYALLLAGELRRSHNINSRFIVGDPKWEGLSEVNGFPVTKIAERSARSFERLLDEQAGALLPVLLQYVGYGYEKRGGPLWLVHGLKKWKKLGINRRLVVMFHELFAFGPPWRSSFWMAPLQRSLAKSLALVGSNCFTNLRENVSALTRLTSRPDVDIFVLPVFSNVGEPNMLTRLSDRKARMVVFGSAGWRRQVYLRHQEALEKACRELGITELLDIGPPCGPIPDLSLRCVRKGSLPAEQISQELLDARAGFFVHPVAYLGKSGVFAAYAAHGLAPITHAMNHADNQDGLRLGEHFLSVSSLARCGEHCVESVALRVREWYTGHSISEQAARYANAIRGFSHT